MRELQQIRDLAAAVRENVAKCGDHPAVDPVHDTRTGTRRLQATLENLVRATPAEGPGAAVRAAATAAMRELKKIRRAAGPVRDLDVHRKLLGKLEIRAELAQSCQALDSWLGDRREQLARDLRKEAVAALPKFDKRVQALETALRARGLRSSRAKPPALLALENFARLATQMQALHAGNLHDFRKGTKKARYVAELAASGDEEAARVGQTLKKLQDEIGDWHDWLVLAEEARAALGHGTGELIWIIDGERDRHFASAMKVAAKLRGRLMGEWLAVERQYVRKQPAKASSTAPRPRPAAAR